MKNSKVVSFLSPFKVGQAGNLWTLPRIYRYRYIEIDIGRWIHRYKDIYIDRYIDIDR